MTSKHGIGFGPRLIAAPTGRLRTAVLVKPSVAIEGGTALIGEPGAVYARALEQHGVLRATLEYAGVEVIEIESRGDDPYESGAGDTAVPFEDGAVMMRLTSMSRRAEVDRMQTELARLDAPLAGHIEGPGLLDGSDVMLAGETAFIGVGARGNEIGRAGFAALARARGLRVVEVRLAADAGALRAVATAVAPDTIVLGADTADLSAFAGFKTVLLARGEERAAGALLLDERHVLADIRYRTALAAMRRAGIAVEAIDLYEFTKLGLTPSMLTLALRRE
jgi:dimethylargininase